VKIGTMLNDIVESFFKKSATQLYPAVKITPPDRYRGELHFSPKACTGCAICVKDCPSQAIELTILDRAAKRYVLKYHRDRCVYCGQCVVNCKFKCLGMSHEDWEHATLEKQFTAYYGNEADVAQLLENLAAPVVEPVSG
jgi:formate hydrogenlyase subunit 6/NADH:ubiquinone oxidoreductase subunit I